MILHVRDHIMVELGLSLNVLSFTAAKDNRFLNPKSSYERHAIPNPSRLA